MTATTPMRVAPTVPAMRVTAPLTVPMVKVTIATVPMRDRRADHGTMTLGALLRQRRSLHRLPGGSLRSPARARPAPRANAPYIACDDRRTTRCTRAGAPAEHARTSLRTPACTGADPPADASGI